MGAEHVELEGTDALCTDCERKWSAKTFKTPPGLIGIGIKHNVLEGREGTFEAELLENEASYDSENDLIRVVGQVKWTCPECQITREERKILDTASVELVLDAATICESCEEPLEIVGRPKVRLKSEPGSQEAVLDVTVDVQCPRFHARARRTIRGATRIGYSGAKGAVRIVRFVVPKRFKIGPGGIDIERGDR